MDRDFVYIFVVLFLMGSALLCAGHRGLEAYICSIKGALYRIQILCRRYTFWSDPAGLTIADPPG